jgi:4-amino-4-deoxy-L-arabinose transferase-like glycosyltransferase
LPIRSNAATKPAAPSAVVWLLTTAALLVLRLPHLGGPLDDPHSWRQCDTAHYALDFFRRGIHLLAPAVCWMGPHRTVILEFPLTEAVIALLYRLGGPSLVCDRLVALALFGLATFYLHRIVRLLAGPRPAWLATLAYAAFPLGQFYSRTAHVDFAATALAHAMLFHGLRACRSGAAGETVLAAACGTLAAMIKAPATAAAFVPLALGALAAQRADAWVRLALIAGLPLVGFGLWWRYVDQVNRAAPDWSFLPGYYKGAQPPGWYFGTLAMRLEPANWLRLARRVVRELATPVGALLALAGTLWSGARGAVRGASPRGFAIAWAVGAVLYLLVFFQLNLIHSYYQIPLLAPLAFFVGLGAELALERLPRLGPVSVGALAVALFLALAAWAPRSLGYYRVDWLRVEAGRAIEQRVPPGELVVACDYGAAFSDPRVLFRADREGWSLGIGDLVPDRVRRLETLGARWVAVVTDPEHPALAPPAFLEPARVTSASLAHAGVALGTLHLFELARLGAGGAR